MYFGKTDCPYAKTRLDNTNLFSAFDVDKVSLPIRDKHLLNKSNLCVGHGRRQVCWGDLLYFPTVASGAPIPTRHGTSNNTHVGNANVEGHGSFILGVLHQNKQKKRNTWIKIRT